MELEKIMNMLQPILVMMIASKMDNGAYMLIITMLPLLWPLAQAARAHYLKSRTVTVTVKSRCAMGSKRGELRVGEMAVDAVSKKLIKSQACNITSILIPKCHQVIIADKVERAKYRDAYRPHSFPIPQGNFSFVYRDIPCTASIVINTENKEETTTIMLSSVCCSVDVLHKFVQDAIDEKWEEENRCYPGKIVFNLFNYSQENKCWTAHCTTVQKTFQNVHLPLKLQCDIEADLETFIKRKSLYKQQGIPHKRGYLFYGPPGTGKTSCVHAIAHKLKCCVRVLSLKEITSVKSVLSSIHRRCVILLEEIDLQIKASSLSKQDDAAKKGDAPSKKPKTDDTLVSELMDVLDGYNSSLSKSIIIMTTNHKEDIPEALIRPGRIDRHFYFGLCDTKEATRVAREFSGFPDLPEPENKELMISSAELINRVLLTHVDDHDALAHEMLHLSTTM
jgi:hypothetical protein